MPKKTTQKTRRSNQSSSKGFGFARQMCVLWSKWWTDDKDEDLFWRTAGSGSRATTRRKRGAEDKWNHGDMKPDAPEGYELCAKWCFEFKFYQKYDIKGVIHHVNQQSDWMQWWAKIVDEAEAVGRDPILVTKQNKGKPIIWFHEDTWFGLQRCCDMPEAPMIRMFEWTDPESVRQVLKEQ